MQPWEEAKIPVEHFAPIPPRTCCAILPIVIPANPYRKCRPLHGAEDRDRDDDVAKVPVDQAEAWERVALPAVPEAGVADTMVGVADTAEAIAYHGYDAVVAKTDQQKDGLHAMHFQTVVAAAPEPAEVEQALEEEGAQMGRMDCRCQHWRRHPAGYPQKNFLPEAKHKDLTDAVKAPKPSIVLAEEAVPHKENSFAGAVVAVAEAAGENSFQTDCQTPVVLTQKANRDSVDLAPVPPLDQKDFPFAAAFVVAVVAASAVVDSMDCFLLDTERLQMDCLVDPAL